MYSELKKVILKSFYNKSHTIIADNVLINIKKVRSCYDKIKLVIII